MSAKHERRVSGRYMSKGSDCRESLKCSLALRVIPSAAGVKVSIFLNSALEPKELARYTE